MIYGNIATQVKGYLLTQKHVPFIGRDCVKATMPLGFDVAVDDLYSFARRRIYEDERPIWEIRTGKDEPLEFIAQYTSEPLGIIVGEAEPEIIDETCRILHNNILWPKNHPTDAYHWFNQSITKSPSRHPVLAGLLLFGGVFGINYAQNIALLAPERLQGVVYALFPISLCLGIWAVAHGVIPALGALGDKIALRKLPKEARHFSYGIQAIQEILAEYGTVRDF